MGHPVESQQPGESHDDPYSELAGLRGDGPSRPVTDDPEFLATPSPWWEKKWLRVAGGVVVAVALLVWGLGSSDSPIDEILSDGPDDEEMGLLEVGECTDHPSEDVEYFQVNEVNCTERHALEVFALVDARPGEDERFPGHDEAWRLYERLCVAEFEEYVGASPAQSDFGVYTVYPGKAPWDEGFTEGIYLLGRYNLRGFLLTSVGSARNSGA